MEIKLSAKERIYNYILEKGIPLAIHEINLFSISQNAASSRLNEMERAGMLKSRFRILDGIKKQYKEWGLPAWFEAEQLTFRKIA